MSFPVLSALVLEDVIRITVCASTVEKLDIDIGDLLFPLMTVVVVVDVVAVYNSAQILLSRNCYAREDELHDRERDHVRDGFIRIVSAIDRYAGSILPYFRYGAVLMPLLYVDCFALFIS